VFNIIKEGKFESKNGREKWGRGNFLDITGEEKIALSSFFEEIFNQFMVEERDKEKGNG